MKTPIITRDMIDRIEKQAMLCMTWAGEGQIEDRGSLLALCRAARIGLYALDHKLLTQHEVKLSEYEDM